MVSELVLRWAGVVSTGLAHEPVRRYERERRGDMLHVDVKKLGNIPNSGGWRSVGRAEGVKN